MKNDKKRRGGQHSKAPAENVAQRILRKVFCEDNTEAMEAKQIYDATVDAVMQGKRITFRDLDDVAKEMMHLDRRAMWAYEIKSEQGQAIGQRYAQEANVLEWAMDEIRAALRPGNQYGGRQRS